MDELPQQKLFIPWRQVESQTGLFDPLESAIPFGDPLKRPA
jgi:hypothetical protein